MAERQKKNVQLVSQNSRGKNHESEKVTSVFRVASKDTRHSFVSVFCDQVSTRTANQDKTSDVPLRATMFHAVGLNTIANKASCREVWLTSIRERDLTRRASILESMECVCR